jgi:hypothetical protein
VSEEKLNPNRQVFNEVCGCVSLTVYALFTSIAFVVSGGMTFFSTPPTLFCAFWVMLYFSETVGEEVVTKSLLLA